MIKTKSIFLLLALVWAFALLACSSSSSSGSDISDECLENPLAPGCGNDSDPDIDSDF